MDDDNSKRLDFYEFRKGIHDYGVDLELNTIQVLFVQLDRDKSGNIDFDEFLRALRVSLYLSTIICFSLYCK